MSARLFAAVGPVRARELSFTARHITGTEALEYGIASHCVPLAELDSTVTDLAATIAENSPDSIATYKDLYLHQQDLGVSSGLDFEYNARYDMSGASSRIGGFGN